MRWRALLLASAVGFGLASPPAAQATSGTTRISSAKPRKHKKFKPSKARKAKKYKARRASHQPRPRR